MPIYSYFHFTFLAQNILLIVILRHINYFDILNFLKKIHLQLFAY